MAIKNNIRSIRFSDELMEIINDQVGDNFNQRFERLVYNCYMLLPEKERQLALLESRIRAKQEELADLCVQYDIASRTLHSVGNAVFDIKSKLSALL
jgi:chromosome condensin MukBEF complex kleisin-like MukF subunit